MKELLPLLASATVGGIIGYSTNWVAIKMLFRPLVEKRFLGIRVPFTPGVIPKQRQALGTSIGKTVNEYLFTREALIETLQNEMVKEKVITFIDKQLNILQKSEYTIKNLLINLDIEPDKLASTLIRKSYKNINTPVFKNYLTGVLTPITKSLGSLNISDILKETDYKNLEDIHPKITMFLTDFINQKISYASENSILVNDMLSMEVKKLLMDTLLFNTPQILSWVSEQFDKEDIRQLVEEYISDLLSGNFLGNILSGILPPATLSKMVCDKFKEGLIKPQALVFVQDKLDDILISFYNKEITTVLSDNFQEDLPNIIEVALKSVYPHINNTIVNTAEKYHQLSINDIAEVFNIDVSKMMTNKIIDSIELYLKDVENIERIFRPILEYILSTPLKTITGRINDEQVVVVAEKIIDLLLRSIDKYGKEFLETLNVKAMVEKQINRLELLQVEEIVLSVMNNQLKTITRFGLLLGALLGLIMPFINSWVGGF